MSNKFSAIRRQLPRPKVCKSPKPLPKQDCGLDENSITQPEFSSSTLEGFAFKTGFPDPTFVEVSADFTAAIEASGPILNSKDLQTFNVENFEVPGTYTGNIIFTWPDSTTCSKPLSVTVTIS